MKLEVGKYYRTRDGRKVEIVGMDDLAQWPFNGDNGDLYTEYGEFYGDGCESRRDLIAPWTDTPEVGTLKEIGAQVGDVVQLVRSSCRTFIGETGTVEDGLVRAKAGIFDNQYEDTYQRKWRIISRANHANQAPTGPVRTVTTTRKEIVPGVYGLVTVDDGAVRMGYFMPDEDDLSRLTAAIATLTEIRDALQ